MKGALERVRERPEPADWELDAPMRLGAFYPDVIGVPAQGRHLSYHWDGERIDKLKDVTSGVAYRVEASSPAPNDVAGQH